MCKKLFLVAFVCVLSMVLCAQAGPLPVTMSPSVEAIIGNDGIVPPEKSNYKTYDMQIINTVDQRRVTLVSYNISGLKKDYQIFTNMTISNLGSNYSSGKVDIYGVIESQDNISSNLSWNNAPGVVNSKSIQKPVNLDKADLTEKLLTISPPARGERKSTGTGQALADFLNADTDGTVTFLLAPEKEGTNILMRTTRYPGGGMILEGEITTGIDIIWVSFHENADAASAGAVSAGFTEAPDRGYTDLLNADGHNVTRYLQTGTPDVNLLNAADLVIISRSVSSGSFQNEKADNWNTLITVPIINVNGYTLRKNRLGFMTGNTIPDTTGDVKLAVNDSTHPIFKGIDLADGVMANNYAGICTYPSDPNLAARGISIVTDPANAQGTVLATVAASSDPNVPTNGPAGGIVIAEWPAGAVLTHDGGAGTSVLAGHRLMFLTGSREASGKNSEGTGMMDLSSDGIQMFLNAVVYMATSTPVEPVHAYTFEDGTANDSVGQAHGTLVGGAVVADGAMVTTAQDQWLEMPGSVIAMNTYDEVTIEAWYIPTEGANTSWTMLAYFGDSVNGLGSNGFFITSARADNKSRAAISIGDIATPWASESGADGPEYDDGLLHQMASTINATDITLYIDGELIAKTALSEANKISGISQNYAYLAKGGYGGDPEWIGAIEEFNIYNVALREDQISANFAAGLTK